MPSPGAPGSRHLASVRCRWPIANHKSQIENPLLFGPFPAKILHYEEPLGETGLAFPDSALALSKRRDTVTDSQFCVYMISQWFVAGGTILLAIVAVFGGWLKQKILRPKLILSLVNPAGEHSLSSKGVKLRYYHLSVRNNRRHCPAHNVRVLLKGFSRPDADGHFRKSDFTGAVQLMWQFAQTVPQFPTIGPEMVCDLGYIPSEDRFRLATIIYPIKLDPSVKPNEKVRLTLQAVSDEKESKPLSLEISWDGLWSEDTEQMRRHLVIKEIKANA